MRKILLSLVLCFVAITVCAQYNFPSSYGIHTYIIGNDEQQFYKDCKNEGFEWIEVNPGEYGSGSTVEEIEAGSLATAEMMDAAGVKAWAVHLPYGMAGSPYDICVTNETTRKANVARLINYIKALSRVFKPERMVLHPSGEPNPVDGAREENIQAAIRSIAELGPACKEAGTVLCVENLPRTCLGNTPEELLRLVEPTPGVKICFDTNHYLTGTAEHFIRTAGHLIATVHVSDYDFTDEKHWLPGLGKLNWGELLLLLEEAGYDGVLMSESDRNLSGPATPAETRQAWDRIVAEYNAVKADPALRTRNYLAGLGRQYWDGTTPEEAFTAGDGPGFYKKEAYDEFMTAYRAAFDAAEAGTASAEEYTTLRANVAAALDKLLLAVNPVTTGYYYFKNGNDGFVKRDVNMAMYADEDWKLRWKEYDPSSLDYIFRIEALEGGRYSIRNMGNDAYIHTVSGTSAEVPMSEKHLTDQVIKPLVRGLFTISNTENSLPYHAAGHRDGAGSSGTIVTWQGVAGSSSSWWIVAVDDATVEEMLKDKVSTRVKSYLQAFRANECFGSTPDVAFPAGTDPAAYPVALVTKMMNAYDALTAVENDTQLPDEEADRLIEALESAFQAVKENPNPVVPGLYRLVSAHFGFTEQNKTMGIYATADNELMWTSVDPKDATFVFELTDAEDGMFYIRNLAHNNYIGYQGSYSTVVPLTSGAEVRQAVEALGCFGMVKFHSEGNSVCFHSGGHNEGAGQSGQILIWNSNPLEGSGSSWFFRTVGPDEGFVTGISGAPTLQTGVPADIYSLDGRLVRSAANGLSGLNAGIYIAGNRKIMVR